MAFNALPMYLGELAPKELRGALGSMVEVSVIFGIFLAQILSLRAILGNATGTSGQGGHRGGSWDGETGGHRTPALGIRLSHRGWSCMSSLGTQWPWRPLSDLENTSWLSCSGSHGMAGGPGVGAVGAATRATTWAQGQHLPGLWFSR